MAKRSDKNNLEKNKDFQDGMKKFSEERKIENDFVVETLKNSICQACRNFIGSKEAQFEVEYDGKSIKVFHVLEVVEDDTDIFDEALNVLLEDAIKIDPNLKVGDKIRNPFDTSVLTRSSISVAKNNLKKETREYEKQKVYDEYKDKEHEMVTGIVKTIDNQTVLVDIKNTIAFLRKEDQIPNEVYKPDQIVRALIKQVSKESKSTQVLLTRASDTFIRRLLEKEIPEIAQGLLEIKAMARDAGERTKVAVYSKSPDIDAIGSCIGPRGSRIQAVISELNNFAQVSEKIDVFEWKQDVGQLVKNCFSPAEIVACFYSNNLIDPELTDDKLEKLKSYNEQPLVVVVEDDKLSLAIGKKGKNVRLATKLIKRKLDIKPLSKINELGIDINKEVEDFKLDQERIAKEKEQKLFLQQQEQALKLRLEHEIDETNQDEALIDTVFEEVDVKQEEKTYVDIQNENIEESTLASLENENSLQEDIKSEPKKSKYNVNTEVKSKFEDAADVKVQEAETKKRRKKKKDDEDRKLKPSEIEVKGYQDIRPEYSQEELEEIENQELEDEQNSWIYDDDIDFDEYDDYYDEEK